MTRYQFAALAALAEHYTRNLMDEYEDTDFNLSGVGVTRAKDCGDGRTPWAIIGHFVTDGGGGEIASALPQEWDARPFADVVDHFVRIAHRKGLVPCGDEQEEE